MTVRSAGLLVTPVADVSACHLCITPCVSHPQVTHPPSLSPGAAAGVAVGGAAFLCSVVFTVNWLYKRHKRKALGQSGSTGGQHEADSNGRRVSLGRRCVAWCAIHFCEELSTGQVRQPKAGYSMCIMLLCTALRCKASTACHPSSHSPACMAAIQHVYGAALHYAARQAQPFTCPSGCFRAWWLQRRRQGKRRYLLPDAPRPDLRSDVVPGTGQGSSVGAAGMDDTLLHDDTGMSPDQIRPQLRSLGDSVTSAVR